MANDGRNMNDLIFLERMYAAGAGGCFDVMSAPVSYTHLTLPTSDLV